MFYRRRNCHLKLHRKRKKWNLIGCMGDVRMHQPHCKTSSGRNNVAENIAGGKQGCQPCRRKRFKSQRSYQAHLKSHIRCDICDLEACPKVLREHKLTHTKPLVPDEADSNRHSHPPFCEPLVVTVTSKPIHVQPQQTVYNECTTGKDTILSADSAPDGAAASNLDINLGF